MSTFLSFEAGEVWILDTPCDFSGVSVETDSAGAKHGSNYLRLTERSFAGTTVCGNARTTVSNLVPGSPFRISGFYTASHSSSLRPVFVSIDGVTIGTIYGDSATYVAWGPFTFTPSGTTAELQFSVTAVHADASLTVFKIDSVTVDAFILAPDVIIYGSFNRLSDGVLLARLKEPVNVTDPSSPTIQYRSSRSVIKGIITSAGSLYDETGLNQLRLYPSQGARVVPSSGNYYVVDIYAMRDQRKVHISEFWQIDSSLSSIELGDIPSTFRAI